jgi:hypothetical protein
MKTLLRDLGVATMYLVVMALFWGTVAFILWALVSNILESGFTCWPFACPDYP